MNICLYVCDIYTYIRVFIWPMGCLYPGGELYNHRASIMYLLIKARMECGLYSLSWDSVSLNISMQINHVSKSQLRSPIIIVMLWILLRLMTCLEGVYKILYPGLHLSPHLVYPRQILTPELLLILLLHSTFHSYFTQPIIKCCNYVKTSLPYISIVWATRESVHVISL